jgi:hypothetical protein
VHHLSGKLLRSISHSLSRVNSRGSAASCLSGAGRIACTAVGRFVAFSCPCPPSSTFDKLRTTGHPEVHGLPHVKPIGPPDDLWDWELPNTAVCTPPRTHTRHA